MKIVAFEDSGARRLGVIEGDSIIDLQAADSRMPNDLGPILAAGDIARLADVANAAPASARRALKGLKYALPVARPGKIICLGLNYLEHAKEGGHLKPQHPSIFMRCTTSLTAHEAPLVRPQASVTLDFECELALIVGKRMRHATKTNTLSCVAGYSCFNDGSVREFQRRTSQWDYGKNFDGTGGFGPWFVSADELPAGAKGLKIETRLNGQVMQSDNTSNMIFPIIETIVDVTQGMTLEPGDVIVTGTPSGVGHARKPPVWMKHGDTVEIEVEGVGVLRNPVMDEV